jgi:hypothetical protein
MRILGLDVSTTTIGYCVMESDDRSIVELGHISLKNVEGLFNKVDFAVPKIAALIVAHNVSKTYVEEGVQMFTTGMSSAQTILTLAKFNALISYHVRNQLGDANLAWVKPNEARKSCGLILTTKAKAGGKSQKEQTFDQLTAPNGLLSHVKFELTKTGKQKPENYDRADAYVVAYHGAAKAR